MKDVYLSTKVTESGQSEVLMKFKSKKVLKAAEETGAIIEKGISIFPSNILNDDDTTDSDEFKEFNIHLDLTNIKYEIELLGLKEHEEFFVSSMEKAVSVLKKLLKVKPLREEYQLEDRDFETLNITKWNTSLFGT